MGMLNPSSLLFPLNTAISGVCLFSGSVFRERYLQDSLGMNLDDFLYPRSRYHGPVNPENLVFNANLQEFAQKVGYVCALETNGKIPPEEAYNRIKSLWKQLKQSKKSLGIGQSPFQEDDESEQGNSAPS